MPTLVQDAEKGTKLACEEAFGTSSWAAVEAMPSERLRVGKAKLDEICLKVAASMAVDATTGSSFNTRYRMGNSISMRGYWR